MEFQSRVIRYGDNINTDVIIPARYLNTSDSGELALHCMEDLDSEFQEKLKSRKMIAGGKNFGCGSSREHAGQRRFLRNCHQFFPNFLSERL